MLEHRMRTTRITTTDQKKDCTLYTMEDTSKIICFPQSIKKSDMVTILSAGHNTATLMLTGPAISRPAFILAQEHSIEVVNEDLYSIDRMKSNLLPVYTVMTTAEILYMENRRVCTRDLWPVLRADDPLALYLGLKSGTCVFVLDLSGVENVRHVV
jgi:hypothetical protein